MVDTYCFLTLSMALPPPWTCLVKVFKDFTKKMDDTLVQLSYTVLFFKNIRRSIPFARALSWPLTGLEVSHAFPRAREDAISKLFPE